MKTVNSQNIRGDSGTVPMRAILGRKAKPLSLDQTTFPLTLSQFKRVTRLLTAPLTQSQTAAITRLLERKSPWEQ